MARLRRHSLQELMDGCDASSPRSAEEQAWLDLVPVGLEIDGLDSVPGDSVLPEAATFASPANGQVPSRDE